MINQDKMLISALSDDTLISKYGYSPENYKSLCDALSKQTLETDPIVYAIALIIKKIDRSKDKSSEKTLYKEIFNELNNSLLA